MAGTVGGNQVNGASETPSAGRRRIETRVLVCFALKEEAGPFRRLAAGRPRISILITGIGGRNAERAIREALAQERPDCVITSGFAGGVRPELPDGTVLYEGDLAELEPVLVANGARRGRFHCQDRVAVTAQEKGKLWRQTGADAVEMESGVIRAVCDQEAIPSATVRIILDTAGEDLPLDFNKVLTAGQRMHGGKLALAILKSPGKIGALRRLRGRTNAAAERLGEVLSRVLIANPESEGRNPNEDRSPKAES
jgi:adenosylhomocysteine nucleosidase